MVPKLVNVKELVGGLNFSRTRTENIKSKVYYFLSLLVNSNDTYRLNNRTNGYRNISSVIMKKIMGRKHYYLIINLLSDPNNPIIETNNSWRSSTHGGEAFCKAYRLCQKYNTGEAVFKTIPAKLKKRITKHSSQIKTTDFDDSKYHFLYDQFKIYRLTVDPSIYDYIYSFGQILFQRVIDGNQYQETMVLNLIGRWLYYVKKIEDKEFWYKVSSDNKRLNSTLTRLNTNLRPFILCNGSPLGMIDISASQPYLLSAMLSNNFLYNNSTNFSLSSIYPEAFDILKKSGVIKSLTGNCDTSQFGYNSYSGTSIHTDFNLRSCSSTQIIQNSFFPFMWGILFNENEQKSIEKYQSIPFDKDFYSCLINNYWIEDSSKNNEPSLQREKLKDNIMFVLFDRNLGNRNNNPYIKMFHNAFPGVDKWICTMLKTIGGTKFSYLLQKTESYLILDVICRDFHEKFPSAPIYTIHDSICTYPEYLPDLKSSILGHFQRIIGHPVGLKESLWIPNPEPNLEDIEKKWAKIRPVTTSKKYENVQHKVFSSNIERATEFFSARGLPS